MDFSLSLYVSLDHEKNPLTEKFIGEVLLWMISAADRRGKLIFTTQELETNLDLFSFEVKRAIEHLKAEGFFKKFQEKDYELYEVSLCKKRINELSKTKTKENKPKNEEEKKSLQEYDQELFEIAELWAEYSKNMLPYLKPKKEKYYTDLLKVKKSCGFNNTQIKEIFRFVTNDDFWRTVAISPTNLLSKSKRNGLRKIDNIVASLRKTHYAHTLKRQDVSELKSNLKTIGVSL